MSTLRLTLFTILLVLGAMPLPVVAAPAAVSAPKSAPVMTTPVLYDKKKDTLSVEAMAVPLKEILGHIAMQSGIEILFDGRADRPVTAKFHDRPFEEALKNLLKESNYSLRYNEGKKGTKPLLIGVKVLPAGEKEGDTTPLMALSGEAFIQEKNRRAPLSAEEAKLRNLSYERWKARLAELPPKVRAEVEKRAKERLDAQQKRKEDREKRHAEAQTQREARKTQREASRQEMENAMTPEQRALREERRAAAKTMAAQRLQNDTSNDDVVTKDE